MEPTRRRPLARELSSGYRLIVAAAAVMVAAVIGMLAYTLLASDPARQSAERTMSANGRIASDFLDVRSDARMYLLTGGSSYQRKYGADRAVLERDLRRFRDAGTAALAGQVKRLEASVGAWIAGYGDATTVTGARASLFDRRGEIDQQRFTAVSLTGNRLAADVQSATDRLGQLAHETEEQADSRDRLVLILGGVFLVLVGSASAVIAASRSRRLVASFGEPIAQLIANVQSVGRGDFAIQLADSDVIEVAELADGIADMATSLRLQRKALSVRAEQAQRLAERLRRVLGFTHEISGSLTMPTVLASITKAACLLGGTTQARVWLLDDDGELSIAHVSELPLADGGRPLRRLGEGAVGTAAASCAVTPGAPGTDEAGRCALPMVTNGRAIGVLEIALPTHRRAMTDEILEVLEVVTAQGATAIEAARLYQHTELLSLSDPLTGLGNRRRMDHELALEVERAVRYDRPMTLLMVDVDHFKSVNDGHGHAQGDLVLQTIARSIGEHLRSVDSAYRYGGEELAVLARETDLAGGVALAERLRLAVESAFAATATPVTVSIGIAGAPGHGGDADSLVQAADDALYAAKRAGRNRVLAAPVLAGERLTARIPSQP